MNGVEEAIWEWFNPSGVGVAEAPTPPIGSSDVMLLLKKLLPE